MARHRRAGARLALLQLLARGGQLLAESVQLLRRALLRLRNRLQLRALLLQLLQRLLPFPPSLQRGLLLTYRVCPHKREVSQVHALSRPLTVKQHQANILCQRKCRMVSSGQAAMRA